MQSAKKPVINYVLTCCDKSIEKLALQYYCGNT